MKQLPVSLAAHYATGGTTTAFVLKFTRTDGAVYGWTSATRDVRISGVDYLAAPGLTVKDFVASAGFAVDNTEITILPDDAIITKADILAGYWNNASWEIWRYNWASPSDGVEPIGRGLLGEIQPRAGSYVAEMRGLQQYLEQTIGSPSSKTCRARLGDAKCRKDLTAFTFAGTLTSVASRQIFTASALGQSTHYFAEGEITWLTGSNSGLTHKVKAYTIGGIITLALPTIYAVTVGDTFSIVAGCRKRVDEDCLAKFDNVLNFQGEPHRPNVDEVTATPDVSV